MIGKRPEDGVLTLRHIVNRNGNHENDSNGNEPDHEGRSTSSASTACELVGVDGVRPSADRCVRQRWQPIRRNTAADSCTRSSGIWGSTVTAADEHRRAVEPTGIVAAACPAARSARR